MTREKKAEWQRAYVAKHRDEINARRRARYHANREVEYEKIKQWRKDNPELYRAIAKRNWIKGRDKHLARQKAYYAENRETLLAKKRDEWEAKSEEIYRRTRARWVAKPEQRKKAMATVKRWQKDHPDRMLFYNCKRILAEQAGVSFTDIPDDLAEAKVAQILIHRWAKGAVS